VQNNCTVFKDTIVLVLYLMLATGPTVPITDTTRQAFYVKCDSEARSCLHLAVEKQCV